MPRKYLRSVESSYELDSKPLSPIDLGSDLNDDSLAGYDESHYYLRATDYHGHVKNMQVGIPTTFGPTVQRILDSDAFPYKSVGDMTRNYLIHGLVGDVKQLIDAGIPVDTGWFIQEAELNRILFEIEGQKRYLDTLKALAEQLVEMCHWFELNRILHDAAEIDLAPGLEDRRDKLIATLREAIPPREDW